MLPYPRLILRTLPALMLGVLWISTASAEPFRSFHIGNSLTNDGVPEQLPVLSASAGIDHEAGWHVIGGKPLSWIQANPSVATSFSPDDGSYQTTLSTRPWDAVVLQPWRQTNNFTSTFGGDVAMVLDTISRTRELPDNADTVFYLYAAWPNFTDLVTQNEVTAELYGQRWLEPLVPNASTPTVLNRDYYDALLAEVRAQTDADVRLVPIGHALAELAANLGDDLLGFGTFGTSFFADRTHLSDDLGAVVATMTLFATLHDTDPAAITADFTMLEGLTLDPETGVSRLTEARRDYFAYHVGSVVSSLSADTGATFTVTGDPPPFPPIESNVVLPSPAEADYDGDGTVGQDDLNLVLLNWGQSAQDPPAGWVNALPSGDIGQSQLNPVLLNWGASVEPEPSAVPEPALGLLGLAGVLLLRRAC